MRVLWLVRKNLTEHPGGDTTQILQTAAALRRRGVEVELAHDSAGGLSGYDLVHLFHLDRLWENLEHCRRARDAGRPVALSTIYWPSDEFDRGGRTGVQGWLARALGSNSYQSLRIAQRYLLHCHQQRRPPLKVLRWVSFRRSVAELLNLTSVLLPNSRAEQQVIEDQFGVQRPTVPVPNAANVDIYRPPAGDAPPQRRGVLCVGRIEPRKNQLALIRALRGTRIPLTLVGQPGRFSRGYYRRCLKEADADTSFVAAQPPEKLRSYYQAAQVHACVSWYETPGLVSLEAALCGCAIVATPGGCTREYLGEEAAYASPDDPASIRAAVEAALARGPSGTLAKRIRHEYTWDAAAEKTAEGYRLALAAN